MILKVILFLRICSCLWRANAGDNWGDDFDLEKQLKILNKPALKTFETEEGDIIDCVNIYNQPAFDHPRLRNHKLQESPSPSVLRSYPQISQGIIPDPFKAREPCPHGTVPIVRVHKEDLIRAKSVPKESLPMEIHLKSAQPNKMIPGQRVLSLTINTPDYPKYGGGGMTTVYNLTVQNDQFSGVQLWVISGPDGSESMILAGWRVFPGINRDGLTRLFTYWTGDGKYGCYNTECSGFVQTHRSITPNYPIPHTSTPGGEQMALTFDVIQDRQTGNWWFVLKGSIVIGYWPKYILDHLSDGAQYIAFGGVAKAGKNGLLPPMGSGTWPGGDYDRTCYFARLHYMDGDNSTRLLPPDDYLHIRDDKCYGFVYHGYLRVPHLEYTLELGGPGGVCS